MPTIVLELSKDHDVERKILFCLVATSGDTGKAIGEIFKGLDGIQVYLLYPKSEISSIQKKQLDTIGYNVQAIAIDGKFDDCQDMVKEAFVEFITKELPVVPPPPKSLMEISNKQGKPDYVPNDYQKFKEYLLRRQ